MNEDFKIMASGSLAGLAQVLTGHPFDTTKVRYINNTDPTVMSCIRTIRSDGYLSFYRGVMPPMIGSVIMNIQVFYMYSLFSKYFHDKPMVAGSLTGLSLATIESPVDLIKSRMQINPSISYAQTIKTIGIKNLYKGLTITSLRNSLSVGLFFWGYDRTKSFFDNEYTGVLLGGAAAGFMCWGPTYPLDNIKTRIQTDTKGKYTGILDCVQKTYRNKGFRGFWNGFSPCISRAVVVNPFVFLAYEIGIKYFQ